MMAKKSNVLVREIIASKHIANAFSQELAAIQIPAHAQGAQTTKKQTASKKLYDVAMISDKIDWDYTSIM